MCVAFIFGTNVYDIHRHLHNQISSHPLIWEKRWPHYLLPPSAFSCPSPGVPRSCPCGISPSSSKAEMEPPPSQKTQPLCWSTTPPPQVSATWCHNRAAMHQDRCMKVFSPSCLCLLQGWVKGSRSQGSLPVHADKWGAPGWLPCPNGSSRAGARTRGPSFHNRCKHFYCTTPIHLSVRREGVEPSGLTSCGVDRVQRPADPQS